MAHGSNIRKETRRLNPAGFSLARILAAGADRRGETLFTPQGSDSAYGGRPAAQGSKFRIQSTLYF